MEWVPNSQRHFTTVCEGVIGWWKVHFRAATVEELQFRQKFSAFVFLGSFSTFGFPNALFHTQDILEKKNWNGWGLLEKRGEKKTRWPCATFCWCTLIIFAPLGCCRGGFWSTLRLIKSKAVKGFPHLGVFSWDILWIQMFCSSLELRNVENLRACQSL